MNGKNDTVATLLPDLFHFIREFLAFVKDYLQDHQERLGEKEVREHYGQVVSRSVEEIDLTLTQFLHFMKVRKASLPVRETETLNTLIEELLEKHGGRIEGKRTHLSKKFEEKLPETIVPRAELFFILNSLIECLIAGMPSEGKFWISTKTITMEGGPEAGERGGSRKYDEVTLVSTFEVKRQGFQRDTAPKKVQPLDLMLPLIEEIIHKNRGMMKYQPDEKSDVVSIKMKLPVERRGLARHRHPGTIKAETGPKDREAKALLSSRMEVVRKMASGIAHELNNILTPIIGNADLLLQDLKHQEPAYHLVKAVMEAGERGGHLGKNLLIIAHGHPMNPVVINLNDFILSRKKAMEDILGEGIQCHFLFKADLKPIKADSPLMEQLILNLLSNARQAMPKGGKVKIATENTCLDQAYYQNNPDAHPGDHVKLSLSDTGTGIAPDLLNSLFEPYPSVKPGGGGLGLSIVYSIVKRLQGHITVHCTTGEGTTFEIYIPSFPAEKEVPKPLSAKKVLIVEPESELLWRIHSSCSELARIVIAAQSGEQAISEISNDAGSIDLLVTDVVLPGKSGVDLAKNLWRKFPAMKTIFITSCPEDWKSIFKGAVQVVAKPVDMGILIERVRQALGK